MWAQLRVFDEDDQGHYISAYFDYDGKVDEEWSTAIDHMLVQQRALIINASEYFLERDCVAGIRGVRRVSLEGVSPTIRPDLRIILDVQRVDRLVASVGGHTYHMGTLKKRLAFSLA